jgi:hypothetical protein
MKAGVAFALRVPNHRNCEWRNVHRHGTGCQAKHFGPLLCRLLGYGRDYGNTSQNQWQRGEARRRIDDFAPFAASDEYVIDRAAKIGLRSRACQARPSGLRSAKPSRPEA